MQSFNLLKNQVHNSLVSLWATPVAIDTKQKVTGIKDVENLQVRIEKLEEIFSYLRNRKLKQKEVILRTDDETSSKEKDDTSSNDEISSSDVEWQLPKNTQEQPPKPHYGLRSLGPLKEEMVHVKKSYNMVKVTNVVLGLKASNS
ncbi:hypothetical protein Tco_1544488 [Tanacetum coccineum]